MTARDPREQIQKLLVTGDNRLKQGVAPEKVRATYEQALRIAREAGLEDRVRPLVEVRLADLDRLAHTPSGGAATLAPSSARKTSRPPSRREMLP